LTGNIYTAFKDAHPDWWAEMNDRVDQQIEARDLALATTDGLAHLLRGRGWVFYRQGEIQSPNPNEIVVDDPATWQDRRVVRLSYGSNETEIEVKYPEREGNRVVFNGRPDSKFRVWGPPKSERAARLPAFLEARGISVDTGQEVV
jgi:hypothetical protein